MSQGVSIIIVSYESGETLDFCLSSLVFALQGLESQVIVWDNNSQTLDKEYFLGNYPDICWKFHDENIGFGKACNRSVQFAEYPNLVFLNPDTISLESSIAPIVEELESSPEIGVVGGKVMNADGSLQMACRRSFPTPSNALYRLLGLSRLFPQSPQFAAYDLRYLDPDKRAEVEAVSGSFFGIRRDLFKSIEGFDERFFMYGEDLDLCRRVQLAGKNNIYLPQAPMIHLKGKSASSRPWKSFYNFYEAMVIFSKIHYGKVMLAHLVLTLGVITSAFLAFNARILSRWREIPVDVAILCLLAYLGSLSFENQFTPRPRDYMMLAVIAVFINLIVGKYGPKQSWKFWEFLFYSTPGIGIVFRYFEGDFTHLLSIIYLFLFPMFYLTRSVFFWVHRRGLMFLRKRRKVVFVGDGVHVNALEKTKNEDDHIDCLGFISSPHTQEIVSPENFLGTWEELDRIYRSLGPFELWILSEKTAWWREKSSNLQRISEKMPIFLVYETSQSRLFNVVNLHLDKLNQ